MKRLIIMMMALLLLSINGIARNMTYERTDSIRIVELLQKGRSLKRGDQCAALFRPTVDRTALRGEYAGGEQP